MRRARHEARSLGDHSHRQIAIAQRARDAEPDRRCHRAHDSRLATCKAHRTMRRSVRLAKRAIDILGGALGLVVTPPLMPLIAAAVYLDSPGPILFRQRRAGSLKKIVNSGGR